MHTYVRVNISDYVQFSNPIHLNNLPVLRPHIAKNGMVKSEKWLPFVGPKQ